MGSKTSARLHAEQHSQSPRGFGHEMALDGLWLKTDGIEEDIVGVAT
jgi:hypothetical protein